MVGAVWQFGPGPGGGGGGTFGASGGNSGSGGGGGGGGSSAHHHHHHSLNHPLQQQQQQHHHHNHHHHSHSHHQSNASSPEVDSLNIIPLKGVPTGSVDSAGSILSSIMGQQQQQGGPNGNPSASSPHIVSNHGQGRISLPLPLTACHRCDVCGKLLSTKLTLKRHKEQQHLQPLNNAVCNLCHKVFRTLNSLNNHKSIYHRRQKQHSGSSPGGGGSGGGNNAGGGMIGSATGLHHQSQFQLHPSQALNALTASAIAAAIEENAVRTAAATAGAVTPTGISAAKSEFKSEYL